MDKLLEIIRRLIIAIVWIGGGGFSLLFVGLALFTSDNAAPFLTLILGLAAIPVTWAVSKLVNWIFIKLY